MAIHGHVYGDEAAASRVNMAFNKKAHHHRASDNKWKHTVRIILAICAAAVVLFNYMQGMNAFQQLQLHSRMASAVDALSELMQSMCTIAAEQMPALWWPLLCGIGVTVFSWSLVYLDSDKPGIRPPMPLALSSRSPQKAVRFRISSVRNQHKRSEEQTFHLNYMMSLASGLIVFSSMVLLRTSENSHE